ncbi:MAG: hypothetical protein ABSH14_13995 [Verrucomicrobiia bacterium]
MSTNHLTDSKPCGGLRTSRRLAVAWIVSLTFLAIGCSTTPRVLEVTSRTRLQNIDLADKDYFIEDQASRIRYLPHDLSIDEQRQEFYVRWGPRSISLVKFEYRQIARPNVIGEQIYTPHQDTANVFTVRGEEFRSGGSVSAWRVSLWDGDHLVAEKKSFLW